MERCRQAGARPGPAWVWHHASGRPVSCEESLSATNKGTLQMKVLQDFFLFCLFRFVLFCFSDNTIQGTKTSKSFY